MTKQQTFLSNYQDESVNLSLSLQKLSLATLPPPVYHETENSAQLSQTLQDQNEISFSNVKKKIKKVSDGIEKLQKIKKTCIKCKKNVLPSGYKSCIKCFVGSSADKKKNYY